MKREKGRSRSRTTGNAGILIDDFPGGAEAFELVSRFCYGDGGGVEVTASNVCALHCGALFLGMTEEVSRFNLLYQTTSFLESMADWSWADTVACIKGLEPCLSYAASCGLAHRLISALLVKIAPHSSDVNVTGNPVPGRTTTIWSFSSSSNSSASPPETPPSVKRRMSATPESIQPRSSITAWWFEDLTALSPGVIELLFQGVGGQGSPYHKGDGGGGGGSLLLTKFLLHYLKSKSAAARANSSRFDYSGLAETAARGVIHAGHTAFSCRGLLWVLRVGSGFGLSRECRDGLEGLIGEVLDRATLDDLLVSSGGKEKGAYDVSLVQRLVRVFVGYSGDGYGAWAQRVKKVGRLVDKYLGEIAPDQRLEVAKFLGVAESLPDSARDCFDGMYRAIDIYLQSHPRLPEEERSKICRCLNYTKLTLEACKDLAKNPRIPPTISVRALISQQPNLPSPDSHYYSCSSRPRTSGACLFYDGGDTESFSSAEEESQDMRVNLQNMQWRVVELEKACREMKAQMSKLAPMARNSDRRTVLPKLC